jgi:hypothetical protein
MAPMLSFFLHGAYIAPSGYIFSKWFDGIYTACKQVTKSIFCCGDVFPSVTAPVAAVTAGKFP